MKKTILLFALTGVLCGILSVNAWADNAAPAAQILPTTEVKKDATVLEESSTTSATPVEISDKKEKTFTGSVVSLEHHDTHFQITLSENPTTGFKWYLTEYDAQLLEPISSNYSVDSASVSKETKKESSAKTKALVGAGGVRTFVFQVKPIFKAAPQKTTIELHYGRPWSEEKGKKKVISIYSS